MTNKKLVNLVCFAFATAFVLCSGSFSYILYRELDPDTKAEGALFRPVKGLADAKPLISVAGVKGIECTFVSDGKKLNGWFYRNPKSDKVILLSHGTAFNLAFVGNIMAIEGLLACGHSVFAYDYPGYGRSEGTANTHSTINSAVAAYDYLSERMHYTPRQISAVGSSLGSAITAQLMSRRQLAKVVLVSGFTSPRAVALDISPFFGIYSERSFRKVGLATIEALKLPHPPLLIVHGEDDELIRVHEAKENFAAASQPKSLLILKHSTHRCPTPPDEKQFIETVKGFLDHA